MDECFTILILLSIAKDYFIIIIYAVIKYCALLDIFQIVFQIEIDRMSY